MSSNRDALIDFRNGLKSWRMCVSLAWDDTKARYRRSILGPLWLTLGTAVWVGGLGAIWSILWNMDVALFLPYLASGLVLWQLITSAIVEGASTFTGRASLIQNLKLPMSLHVLRLSLKNAIIFAHTIIVYVVVALVFDIPVTASTLLVIPGFIVLFFNVIWLTALSGIVCARFRDVSAMIDTLLPMLFFVTPIMWKPEMLGSRRILADINPVMHLIAIVREPLMGRSPDALSWFFVLGFSLFGGILTWFIFSRKRRQIVFWL